MQMVGMDYEATPSFRQRILVCLYGFVPLRNARWFLRNSPKEGTTMNLFVKAGSHGNPGPAAFAVVFERNGQQLTTTDVRYVGHHTANYATLAGLVFGLTEA